MIVTVFQKCIPIVYFKVHIIDNGNSDRIDIYKLCTQ